MNWGISLFNSRASTQCRSERVRMAARKRLPKARNSGRYFPSRLKSRNQSAPPILTVHCKAGPLQWKRVTENTNNVINRVQNAPYTKRTALKVAVLMLDSKPKHMCVVLICWRCSAITSLYFVCGRPRFSSMDSISIKVTRGTIVSVGLEGTGRIESHDIN